MTLDPLLAASLAVRWHVATLALAWLVGIWLFFFSRKGAKWHRALGALFIGLMIATAIITLFIHLRTPNSSFFGLSSMHWYVPLVLALSCVALHGAIQRKRTLHRFGVIGLFFGSLTLTGLVQIFFGDGISHRMFFP
jgi:uncharacterized membrane protein